MLDKTVVLGNITVDRVVEKKKGKPSLRGYSLGGAINVAHYLQELTGPEQVLLVSNIGDDSYARDYIEPELNGKNTDYIRRIKGAETRLYQIDITKPSEPDIIRLKEAQKLMETPFMDITPILPSVSNMHFQSYNAIFGNKYRPRIVELIKKAYEMKVPISLDWNVRKSVEDAKNTDRQMDVLGMMDTLKMNECEAKLFFEPQTNKNNGKVRLRNRELERIADEIMDIYPVKRIVITLCDRGSYVQTRKMSLRFDGLKPHVIMDAIGAGDASSAAYVCERAKHLDEIETGVLSNILGCLAVENSFSFPRTETRTAIGQYIRSRYQYCKKYKVGTMGLVNKLGLQIIS